ncbi:MAG: hypothetical protein AAB011_02450 [Candidatus Eisenbacteria bacterium]
MQFGSDNQTGASPRVLEMLTRANAGHTHGVLPLRLRRTPAQLARRRRERGAGLRERSGPHACGDGGPLLGGPRARIEGPHGRRPLLQRRGLPRLRSGHLLSKGKLFGAQFVGWLEGGYWLELARHANAQAARLEGGLSSISGVRIVWPVEANELFVVMPNAMAARLKAAGAEFYEWYVDALPPGTRLEAGETFVRLVTSFVTTDAQVDQFCAVARGVTKGKP